MCIRDRYISVYVDLNLLVGVMTFTFCPLHCFYATIVEGGAADRRRRPILVPGTYMIQVPGFLCPTVSRSPRCSRGNPRSLPALLMVLVREFESRRGEILSLFAKIKGSTTVAESA